LLIHEEAYDCFPSFTQTSVKGIDVGSTNCPLIQLLITLLEKKYLQRSRVHQNLTSFQECPLVHLMCGAGCKTLLIQLYK